MKDTLSLTSYKTLRRNIFSVRFIVYSFLFLFVFYIGYKALLASHEGAVTLCRAHIFQLGHAVNNYVYYYEKYPSYLEKNTNFSLWSWRAVMLSPWIATNIHANLNEPWNSECNLEQLSRYSSNRYFTCALNYPKEKRASYVAITGPGTVWTEVNNGRLKNPYELCPEKIIIIETTEPKNFWAEPGDDVLPDEVVRLFEADPGLVKNSRKTFFTRGHWPKHFVRADGSVGTFDQIKDVEKLRSLLIVPDDLLEKSIKDVQKTDGASEL